MAYATIVEEGIDILVVGAGLGGTGAAWEARFWGKDKKIVIAEKANIDRSGAVAEVRGQVETARRMRYKLVLMERMYRRCLPNSPRLEEDIATIYALYAATEPGA